MNHLPPGPASPLVTTLKYLRNPYRTLLEMAQRYGDPYTWPSFMGKMVVTGDPAGIRTVFAAGPECLGAFPAGSGAHRGAV
jgi:hypothetical protein